MPVVALTWLLLAAGVVAGQTPAAPPDAARSPLKITARARAIQPGEIVALTIATSQEQQEVRVRVFDREFPAYRTGPLEWRGLVAIDLDQPPAKYTAIVTATGARTEASSYPLTVVAKRFPTRVLTVDPDFVTPPAESEARIVSEAAELERLWTQVSDTRLWTEPFVAPVRAASNSAFGSRSVFNGVARNPHSGADFPSPTGTPVSTPNAGRVVLARDLYFSGNTVIIDHGLGLFSLLAHLSTIEVRTGDVLGSRARVGRVGATGRVTGPHLHWAVRLHQARVDPISLLRLLGPQTVSATGRGRR